MTPPKMLAYCDARNDNRSMRTTRCGLKSFTTAKTHMRPLRAYFAGWPAIRVAYKTAEEYAKKRLALGKKPATVNRELELLRRALPTTVGSFRPYPRSGSRRSSAVRRYRRVWWPQRDVIKLA
jgi:hypothetical protein